MTGAGCQPYPDLAERKRLYLLKHPETAPVTVRGGPGRGRKTTGETRTVSFAADTAAKTDRTERAIQQDVQIAESIPEDVRDAIRLRIEAERKAGQLLSGAPKHPGGRPPGNQGDDHSSFPPKLAELGVSKQQAKDWQRIARVPDEVFAAQRLPGET